MMNKTEILALTDTELFAHFYDVTVRLVKEANSRRGETKKTMKEHEWVIDECVKRFNLDKEKLDELML